MRGIQNRSDFNLKHLTLLRITHSLEQEKANMFTLYCNLGNVLFDFVCSRSLILLILFYEFEVFLFSGFYVPLDQFLFWQNQTSIRRRAGELPEGIEQVTLSRCVFIDQEYECSSVLSCGRPRLIPGYTAADFLGVPWVALPYSLWHRVVIHLLIAVD